MIIGYMLKFVLVIHAEVRPDHWKHAEVRPGVKNNSSFDPSFSNLRPISNLTFIATLTERAVSDQTHDHESSISA